MVGRGNNWDKGPLRIATRGSELALWQARAIATALCDAHPGLAVELSIIRTTGDRVLDVPLSRIGDRGLFTKEIDDTLYQGHAELAVHSLKDVPTHLPEGLALAAVTRRADPRDVLLGRSGARTRLMELAPAARIGTSSLRRRSQIRAARPDLQVLDLRGNLNTRLAKLDAGEYDAIILAAAGVLRLGWRDRISEYLDPPGWLPAVGQGALAVMTREDEPAVRALVRPLHDPETAACTEAERVFLHALEGGCQIPIGALAVAEGQQLHLNGLVAGLEGDVVLRSEARSSIDHPREIGLQVANALLEQGGGAILDQIRRSTTPAAVPPVPAP